MKNINDLSQNIKNQESLVFHILPPPTGLASNLRNISQELSMFNKKTRDQDGKFQPDPAKF